MVAVRDFRATGNSQHFGRAENTRLSHQQLLLLNVCTSDFCFGNNGRQVYCDPPQGYALNIEREGTIWIASAEGIATNLGLMQLLSKHL